MAGEPSGGIVGVDFGKWTLEGSLGSENGSVVGGADIEAHLNRQWSLKAGDQSLGVGIPTETNFSAKVLARGLSMSYAPSPATQITIFGGMGGGGYVSTEILFFTPQIALGAISIDHYLDSKKHFLLFGRALFSNRQAILGGALYQTKRLQTGFAAGIGSNQPHAELLLNYNDKQWEIRSGYLYSGSNFTFLTLPQFRYAQEDRENADVRWRPWKEASFTLSRHEYLVPSSSASSGVGNASATRGTTDMAGGALFLHGIGVGANVDESRFEGTYASAASYLVSMRLSRTVQLSGNYYLPLHSSDPIPMLTVNTEQKINRRLRLSEFATQVSGRWTVSYGGGLNWDRFDVNVDYGTYFAPLAVGGGRFTQQMNLNGHLHLGRWLFGVQTYVQPDGSLLYSYEVRTFYFHPTANGSVQAPQSHGGGLPNFLIVGQVTLEGTGKPVADVPILIGDETVYTDETGAFSLRVMHKRTYKIQLLLQQQIGFHYYEQVSLPAEVMAGTDTAPGQIQAMVRVNQTKTPKLPKGGIVIGDAAASNTATGGEQSGGDIKGGSSSSAGAPQ